MVGGNGSKSKYFYMMAKKRREDKVKSSSSSSSIFGIGQTTGQKSIRSFFKSETSLEKDDQKDNIVSSSSSSCKRARLDGPISTISAEEEKEVARTLRHFRQNDDEEEVSTSRGAMRIQTLSSRDADSPTSSTPLLPPNPNTKPTPLESQVLDLKRRHPDLLLFVECGYRYRFFGEDAEVAARVLGISCHQDRLFLTASVPTFNGPGNYVRKLVSEGHKVGIVSQTETAASKNVLSSSSSSAPFARALTSVFSRTTFLGEDVGLSMSETMAGSPTENVKAMVMAIYEKGEEGLISVCAVQPTTGQVLHEEFADDLTRSELCRCLDLVQPLEVISVEGGLSRRSEEVVRFFCERSRDAVRWEKVQEERFAKEDELEAALEPGSTLGQIVTAEMSGRVKYCLCALHHYLREFGMEMALLKSGNVSRISSGGDEGRTTMLLPALTLRNLEIFQTMTPSHSNKGTLFHVLNRTRTRFGARMLKDWISAPLMDASQIRERQGAVVFLLKPSSQSLVEHLGNGLKKLVDLDISLMATLYHKIRPNDFVRLCADMGRVCDMLSHRLVQEEELPMILRKDFSEIRESFESVKTMLSNVDEEAAKRECMEEIFRDWSLFPDVRSKREEIREMENGFVDHKREIAKVLRSSSFEYVCVSGLEYLAEVKHSSINLVPATWVKINSTKQVARYRSPFVSSNLPRLHYLRECLSAECKKSWLIFLDSFNERFDRFHLGTRTLAEVDCLLSLASVSRAEGFCLPEIGEEDEGVISIKDGRNIVVESLLSLDRQYVPNDVELGQGRGGGEGPRALVLTGPNMGGKSCYIRQLATTAIMCQIGCLVPASRAILPIFDAVFIRVGASDDIMERRSTLMVELDDASLIIKKATARSLVLMDELGRGTGTLDGCAIACAVLRHLATVTRCLTVFVTHYKEVAEMENELKGLVANGHMGFSTDDEDNEDVNKSDSRSSKVLFLFKLCPGQAERSFGLNVARLAGLPLAVIDLASTKAREMEEKRHS